MKIHYQHAGALGSAFGDARARHAPIVRLGRTKAVSDSDGFTPPPPPPSYRRTAWLPVRYHCP